MNENISNHIGQMAELYAMAHLIDFTSPDVEVNRKQYTYDNHDIEDAWRAGYEACLASYEINSGDEPAEV